MHDNEAQAAAAGRPFAEPDRIKCRMDAMIEVLFSRFEPRP
jgi:hypothetical protein